MHDAADRRRRRREHARDGVAIGDVDAHGDRVRAGDRGRIARHVAAGEDQVSRALLGHPLRHARAERAERAGDDVGRVVAEERLGGGGERRLHDAGHVQRAVADGDLALVAECAVAGLAIDVDGGPAEARLFERDDAAKAPGPGVGRIDRIGRQDRLRVFRDHDDVRIAAVDVAQQVEERANGVFLRALAAEDDRRCRGGARLRALPDHFEQRVVERVHAGERGDGEPSRLQPFDFEDHRAVRVEEADVSGDRVRRDVRRLRVAGRRGAWREPQRRDAHRREHLAVARREIGWQAERERAQRGIERAGIELRGVDAAVHFALAGADVARAAERRAEREAGAAVAGVRGSIAGRECARAGRPIDAGGTPALHDLAAAVQLPLGRAVAGREAERRIIEDEVQRRRAARRERERAREADVRHRRDAGLDGQDQVRGGRDDDALAGGVLAKPIEVERPLVADLVGEGKAARPFRNPIPLALKRIRGQRDFRAAGHDRGPVDGCAFFVERRERFLDAAARQHGRVAGDRPRHRGQRRLRTDLEKRAVAELAQAAHGGGEAHRLAHVAAPIRRVEQLIGGDVARQRADERD